jgi:hypothetical protein
MRRFVPSCRPLEDSSSLYMIALRVAQVSPVSTQHGPETVMTIADHLNAALDVYLGMEAKLRQSEKKAEQDAELAYGRLEELRLQVAEAQHKKRPEDALMIGKEDLEKMPTTELDAMLTQVRGLEERLRDVLLAKKDAERQEERRRTECIVCMEREKSIIFLPCKHRVACAECSEALSTCPSCREAIVNKINPFDS